MEPTLTVRMLYYGRLDYVETLAWIKHTSLLGPERAINFQKKYLPWYVRMEPTLTVRMLYYGRLDYVETLAWIKHTSLLGPERAINLQKSI